MSNPSNNSSSSDTQSDDLTLRERVRKVWYDAPDANAGFDAILEIINERERAVAKLYENGEVYTGKRGTK